ncbi:alpha/beta hydrolase [Flavobacterium sp. I-SCBP12n]|uniref:Alpha/beta hydrolase n=1 Tax=Flavobacterium pygoscelis TaxID=2893176 RepID=A0A9X1XRC9_9FLAO|nr:alpha/beta hydrolase [Flavobacterium pygoscelis]MCK8142350.1 alpha/beta hydrolase [Flavobacterium pygoscelis]
MKQTQFKNTQISYSDVGKGTAIVLLHGFLENKTMWDFYVPEFAKKNRVITIDLLGHGESECLGYVHSMEDHADAVYAVLSELRIRKAFFVGHSMGGYVALAFAELYPEYIKGIVLLNSTAKADNEERKINRDRAVKAVKQSFVNFISLSIANLFSENNRERLALEIDKVKKEALKTPLQGIVASLEGMKIRTDREHVLHLSTFPILMVLGEKDPVLPYHETSKQIEQTKVELITYADGHMSYIENQENLLKVLIAFFKKI